MKEKVEGNIDPSRSIWTITVVLHSLSYEDDVHKDLSTKNRLFSSLSLYGGEQSEKGVREGIGQEGSERERDDIYSEVKEEHKRLYTRYSVLNQIITLNRQRGVRTYQNSSINEPGYFTLTFTPQ